MRIALQTVICFIGIANKNLIAFRLKLINESDKFVSNTPNFAYSTIPIPQIHYWCVYSYTSHILLCAGLKIGSVMKINDILPFEYLVIVVSFTFATPSNRVLCRFLVCVYARVNDNQFVFCYFVEIVEHKSMVMSSSVA